MGMKKDSDNCPVCKLIKNAVIFSAGVLVGIFGMIFLGF
jgi:hypothetical protein